MGTYAGHRTFHSPVKNDRVGFSHRPHGGSSFPAEQRPSPSSKRNALARQVRELRKDHYERYRPNATTPTWMGSYAICVTKFGAHGLPPHCAYQVNNIAPRGETNANTLGAVARSPGLTTSAHEARPSDGSKPYGRPGGGIM